MLLSDRLQGSPGEGESCTPGPHRTPSTQRPRNVVELPNTNRELGRMRGQRSCHKKEQDKTSKKELRKTEVSNFPEKNFKAMVIKMLIELRRRI